MSRSVLQPGVLLALSTLVAPLCALSQTVIRGSQLAAAGTLSGVIRDTGGIPQMGALVEAVLPDATLGASAITDSKGHYRIALAPGSYRIRATAALLLPAIRERLQIGSGTRAVLDLTLTTILAPSGWLPISRRNVTDPGDEWMWTLRSSASRSILRFTGASEDAVAAQADGTLAISSSRQESRRGTTAGRVTLKESDGGFAQGGSHNVLVLTRVSEDGSGGLLRGDFSGSRSPFPVAPSAEISVGFQRRTPLNGVSRAVLTYSSHPELVGGHGSTGFQGVTLRSAQRIELGDLIRVDVGSVLRQGNLQGNAVAVEPFLRIASRPGSAVVLAYTMTRSRGTESLDDLDRAQAAIPVVITRSGRAQLERGSHHAVSIAGKLRGGGIAEVAFFRDTLRNPLLAGAGTLSPIDLQGGDLVADPTTRTFRVVARDYSSTGVRFSLRQPITKSLGAGADVSAGDALQAASRQVAALDDVLASLRPSKSFAGTVFVDGNILATGTALRASYRWQPARTLTAVDSFRVGDHDAFLSCSLRQSLGMVRFLPRGLDAVLDVQNLLSEGYQPFLSNDRQTLYLAQTPRTMQAGVSFSF